jgi:hypothetical protein
MRAKALWAAIAGHPGNNNPFNIALTAFLKLLRSYSSRCRASTLRPETEAGGFAHNKKVKTLGFTCGVGNTGILRILHAHQLKGTVLAPTGVFQDKHNGLLTEYKRC